MRWGAGLSRVRQVWRAASWSSCTREVRPSLVVDVGEVGLYGAGRYKELRGNFLIGEPSLTNRTTSSSVGVSDAQPLDGRLRSPRLRCA